MSNTKTRRAYGGKTKVPQIKLFFKSDDVKYPIESVVKPDDNQNKLMGEIVNYAQQHKITVIDKPVNEIVKGYRYNQQQIFTEVYPLFLMLRKKLVEDIEELDVAKIDIRRKRLLTALLRYTKTIIGRIQTIEKPIWLEKILAYISPELFIEFGQNIVEEIDRLLTLPDIDSTLIANVQYDASDFRKYKGRKTNPACDNKMVVDYNFVSKPEVFRSVENLLTRAYSENNKDVPHDKIVRVESKVKLEGSS